jgi:hypothetical protein
LLENHQRYVEAGIYDIWILWDDLRPKFGNEPSPDQGLLLPLLDFERMYSLTKPQRAILHMQTGKRRYIYTFTINPLNARRELVETKLMQTLGVGVCIYCFENWEDQEEYQATCKYSPIAELEFAKDGSFITVEDEDDEIWAAVLSELGLELEGAIIPTQVISQFEQLLKSQEGLKRLQQSFLINKIKALSPKNQQKLVGSLRSMQSTMSTLTLDESIQAFQDADSMEEAVKRVRQLRQQIEVSDLPIESKSLLLDLLNERLLVDTAEWMRWQEESQSLKEARKKSTS